jgi:hypothetical protein
MMKNLPDIAEFVPGITAIEAALKHLQQQRHFSAKQLDALYHHLKKRWPAGMA